MNKTLITNHNVMSTDYAEDERRCYLCQLQSRNPIIRAYAHHIVLRRTFVQRYLITFNAIQQHGILRGCVEALHLLNAH